MTKKIRTHYDNLKILRNAPESVIRAAHRALIQEYHPDRAEDKAEAERVTKIINQARAQVKIITFSYGQPAQIAHAKHSQQHSDFVGKT